MSELLFLNQNSEAAHRERMALVLIAQGRYDEAIVVFKSLFRDGYTEVCLSIGKLMDRPGATDECLREALTWFHFGAEELGDMECSLAIAIMAFRERWPYGDKAAGVRHLVISSSESPLAKALLANLHLEGIHVEQDLDRSEALAGDAAGSEFLYPKLVFARVLMRNRKVFRGLQVWVRFLIEVAQVRRFNPRDPRLDLLPIKLHRD